MLVTIDWQADSGHSKEDDSMLVTVRCPQSECRKTFEIDEANLGRRARCRSCGSRFILTGDDNTNGDAPQTVDGTAGANEESRDRNLQGDIPAQMGRFTIRRRLGVGAFGTVYQAFDPVLNREVAIKVPRTSTLQDERARTRFLREPKAAAQLRHPNIVPVFDAGDDGEHYYIASAYIQGTTLEELVESGEIDLRVAAEIVLALAEALQYAHRLGIVHRDVKPANVMIDEKGQPLLMDFGLAHIAESEEKLTQDGTVMGTPAYMSPEQADRSCGEVGAASDQYSLGVTLYEMLCGERPFSGPPSVVIHNTINLSPDSPRTRNARVPRDLETICLKTLAKRPEDRFIDCSELADELRRWLSGEPIRTRRRSSAEKLVQWTRRNPTVASLSLAFVLITFIFMSVLWSQWRVSEQKRQELERAGGTIQAHEQRIADQRRQIASTDNEVKKRLAEAEQLRNEANSTQDELKKLQGGVKTLQDELDRQRAAQAAEIKRLETDAQVRVETLKSRTSAIENTLAVKEYFELIVEAEQQVSVGDFDGANAKLNSCPPDSRGFEWHHIQQIIDRRARSVSENGWLGLAYRRDGRIVVVQNDGKLLLWEPLSDMRTPIADMQMGVEAHDFTPGGEFVAAVSNGMNRAKPQLPATLKVVDTVTGKLVYERVLGKQEANSGPFFVRLAISPSGKFVWFGAPNTDKAEKVATLLVEVATGKQLTVPTNLAFTFLDDETLLQTSSRGTIAKNFLSGKEKRFPLGVTRIGNQIWEGKTKLLSRELEEIRFDGPIPASVLGLWFASSPSGDFVASPGDGEILIWKTGEYDAPVKSLKLNYWQSPQTTGFILGPGGSSAIVLRRPSAGGHSAAGNSYGRILSTLSVTHLPDLDHWNGRLLYETDAENLVVAISESGKRIITRSTRKLGSCAIRDLTKRGTATFGFELAKGPSARKIAISDEGEMIAADRRNERLNDGVSLGRSVPYEIRACPDHVLANITLRGPIEWCKFSPNGKYFAACDGLNSTLWDIASGDEVKLPVRDAVAMAFTKDGSRLVTVRKRDSKRSQLQVWDIKSATAILEFSFGGWANSLAITSDDDKLLVGVSELPTSTTATEIMVCHLENLRSNLILKTEAQFFDLAATKDHILLATPRCIHVIGDPSKNPFEDVAPSKTEPEAAGVGL